MIIYEFTTWCANGEMFCIKEVEVEEKPKTYITKSRMRINKSDINKLSSHYGNQMYRLDKDPRPYIEAMVNKQKKIIEQTTERLKRETDKFNKWFDLKEMVGEDNG